MANGTGNDWPEDRDYNSLNAWALVNILPGSDREKNVLMLFNCRMLIHVDPVIQFHAPPPLFLVSTDYSSNQSHISLLRNRVPRTV
jgi:hypothetical protein